MTKLFSQAITFSVLFGMSVCASSVSAQTIQSGDLSVIFDQASTVEQQARLLTLKDLRLSDSDFTAILKHARVSFKIQREVDVKGRVEEMKLPKFENNEDENSYLSASPLLRPCIEKMENWKISAIRIAPFEYSLPGSKSVLNEFAKARQAGPLDRVFQVRFVLNPICRDLTADEKVYSALDIGLHVIFNVWPSEKGLRSSLLTPLRSYLQKNEKGQSASAQADLDQHLKALTSKEYKTFYQNIMKGLTSLAQSRGSKAANGDVFSKLYDRAAQGPLFYLTSTTDNGDIISLLPKKDRASAPLKWSGSKSYVNETYFAELKKFVAAVSQRENLERVAINSLVSGDTWFLAGLLAGTGFQEDVFAKDDSEKARKVYQSLFPQELKTVQAVIGEKNSLAIQKVSSSNYYSFLQISWKQEPKNDIIGVEILDLAKFGKVDFYQTQEVELAPAPASNNKIPLSRLLNSPELINASTTSCTTCHVAPVMTGTYSAKEGYREDIGRAFSVEPQEDVRMMGFDRNGGEPVVQSMIINEVALDKKKLDAYLKAGQ